MKRKIVIVILFAAGLPLVLYLITLTLIYFGLQK